MPDPTPVDTGELRKFYDFLVSFRCDSFAALVRSAADELDRLRARVAELEAALKPFAERSEGCRHVADAVAGMGHPSRLQPVPLEWLIRAAEVLATAATA